MCMCTSRVDVAGQARMTVGSWWVDAPVRAGGRHLLERAPEALALVAVWGDDANRHSRRVRRLHTSATSTPRGDA